MKAITENTLIPISSLVFLVGLVAWITTLYDRVEASVKRVDEISQSQEEYRKEFQEIRERLIRIEGALNGKKR